MASQEIKVSRRELLKKVGPWVTVLASGGTICGIVSLAASEGRLSEEAAEEYRKKVALLRKEIVEQGTGAVIERLCTSYNRVLAAGENLAGVASENLYQQMFPFCPDCPSRRDEFGSRQPGYWEDFVLIAGRIEGRGLAAREAVRRIKIGLYHWDGCFGKEGDTARRQHNAQEMLERAHHVEPRDPSAPVVLESVRLQTERDIGLQLAILKEVAGANLDELRLRAEGAINRWLETYSPVFAGRDIDKSQLAQAARGSNPFWL